MIKTDKKAVTSWTYVIRDLNGEEDITNIDKNIAKYKSIRHQNWEIYGDKK